MKKFIGNVNGVEYTNEEEFAKASVKAITSNDGNLSISSYYRDIPDPKFVVEDFIIPVEQLPVDFDYEEALNKNDMKNTFKIVATKKDVQKIKDVIKANRLRGESLKLEIDDTRTRLEKLNSEYDELFNKFDNILLLDEYYTNLIDFEEDGNNYECCGCESKKTECNKNPNGCGCKCGCESKKPNFITNIKDQSILDILEPIATNFSSYLNDIGFFNGKK